MKGTTQFRRKEQEMFLDKFRVVAVTTLKPSHFEHFSKHLLDDFSFIERYADRLCVREDGYADSLLVLSAEGDDGILVNSEGSHYARYSSFLPYAKPLFKKLFFTFISSRVYILFIYIMNIFIIVNMIKCIFNIVIGIFA